MRRFADEIDFSCVYDKLVSKDSDNSDIQNVDRIQLLKYLVLQALTTLSDAALIEEVRCNLAYKYFLGLAPEDMPVSQTALSEFRAQCFTDEKQIDKLLQKILDMAVDKGIIEQSIRQK